MRYFVSIDGSETVLEVTERPGGAIDVKLVDVSEDGTETAGRALSTSVLRKGPKGTVQVDGRVFDLVVDGEMPNLEVFASGRRASTTVETARMRATANVRAGGSDGASGVIVSPMPGKVVKVLVAEGDEVDAGAPLVVVEAMKMENELVAESPGVIKKVYVSAGDAVEGGARLVTVG